MEKRADLPENFYKLVLDSLKEYAVFSTDRDGIITSWSKGAEKVMLYSAHEVIGQSGEVLYTPEDRRENVPAIELSTSLRDGMAIDERFHLKKGGIKFWGSGLVFPLFDDTNRHIGFTKAMKNVSEQPEAEMNLSEEKAIASILVSSSDEPIVVLNANLDVVTATQSFISLFGLDKDYIPGKNFYQIIGSNLDVAQVRTILDSILKNHNFHGNFEVDHVHSKYGTRSLGVKARRIYQPPNLLFKLEFEDLTNLRDIINEKDAFISVASHEVKTPLSVIRAYGQILERELRGSSPLIQTSIEKLNEQAKKMNTLLNALLNTSKITTGNIKLDPEVFNLSELVTEIVTDINVSISSHEVIIENAGHAIVKADKTHTSAVITNLLTNAIKYSPNAKEVFVNLHTDETFAIISVRDLGIGIPAADKGVIFQRFGRTEKVKNSKIPGFGLGLYLSAEIVKLQGGEITFASMEGKGSTFYASLPLFQ